MMAAATRPILALVFLALHVVLFASVLGTVPLEWVFTTLNGVLSSA